MNQRVAVRALLKQGDKILLLRREGDQPDSQGKYELPGGRVEYGEQPEDAVARHLNEQTGLTLGTIQLRDVLTYIDHDNRDVQYCLVLYSISTMGDASGVNLDASHDRYVWRKLSSIQRGDLTEVSHILIGVDPQLLSPTTPTARVNDEKDTTKNKLVIYTDGGSRGNPGPSAAAFVVLDANDHLLAEGGAYLGITTNNQAEYHGVHLGLEKARELGVSYVEFRIDSLLVVNQLNGTYVIRNRELWPIHERIRTLAGMFEKVTFRHVKRELNQHADTLVNKILDDYAARKV